MKNLIFILALLALLPGVKIYCQDSNSQEVQSNSEAAVQENQKEAKQESSSISPPAASSSPAPAPAPAPMQTNVQPPKKPEAQPAKPASQPAKPAQAAPQPVQPAQQPVINDEDKLLAAIDAHDLQLGYAVNEMRNLRAKQAGKLLGRNGAILYDVV